MWKTFVASIGLLALALISALYSSTAARDGRVAAAAVSACVALGIAIGVGIKFVPRLASHVDWDWLPLPSRYQVTLEGWIYLGTVLIVVFAAINTANNLLYMVLSALLAVLALSGFLSALNFRLLRVQVRLPSHCYAGEPFPITIQIHNDKRVFPVFSLTAGLPGDSGFQFAKFYVPVIRGLDHTSNAGQALIAKRGSYALRHVKVISRFPFGFLLKARKYAADARCICYPEIRPEEEMDLAGIDLRGTSERFDRG